MMLGPHRSQNSYDHRIKEGISATGNPDLFRELSIPRSTRLTWVGGDVRPVVTSDALDVKSYELLDQRQKLEERLKKQAPVIGLLARMARAFGGKFDGDRVTEGERKADLL